MGEEVGNPSRSRKVQTLGYIEELREIIKKQEEILQNLERQMGFTKEDNIQKEIEALNEVKKNQEERIKNLESKALQIANLYFVFQGVIFTSTSSASSLQCHGWWFPFTLSLLAAVLNLFAFFGAVFKWVKYSEDLDQILADLEDRKRAKVSISSSNQSSSHLAPGPDKCEQSMRWAVVISTAVLFIGFTVVIMLGCRFLLCK